MDRDWTRRRAIGTMLAGSAALGLPTSLLAANDSVRTRIVETTAGKVRGLRQGGVSRFLGIPYGEDTGQRRFQPPVARRPWAGVRECDRLGPKTLQGMITIPGLMSMPRPGARGRVRGLGARRRSRAPWGDYRSCRAASRSRRAKQLTCCADTAHPPRRARW